MNPELENLPDEVVIRHVCHCETATVAPNDDEDTEHVFTVDGQDFPWVISQRGPIVKRIRDDLYSVEVEIIGFTSGEKHEAVILSVDTTTFPYTPIIGGKPFPWLMAEDDCVLTFSHKRLASLKLAFYTRNVTANIPIEDVRPAGEDYDEHVYCYGGFAITEGKTRCNTCDKLVSGSVIDHIESVHPEDVKVVDGQKRYYLKTRT
jgi:hypothetical protein